MILRFSSRRRSSFRESRIVSLDFYPTSTPLSLVHFHRSLLQREREREREKGREEERESKRFRFKQKDLTSQLGIDGDRHDARILINFLFFDRVSMPPLFLPSLHPPPPWPPPRLFIYRWNGPSQRRRKWQTADIDTAVIEQLSISFLICRAFENLWIFFPILLTFIFFSLLFFFFSFFRIRNSSQSSSLYYTFPKKRIVRTEALN